MKRLTIFMCIAALLSSSLLMPSAWLMFENNTPTSFVCEVQVLCKNTQPLTLQSGDNNPQLAVNIEDQDDESVKVNFRFEFEALKSTNINPIFFSNDTVVYPEILDIFIESPLLQAKYHFDLSSKDFHHFTVNLDNNMIKVESHAVGIITKLRSNVRNVLLAILDSAQSIVERI